MSDNGKQLFPAAKLGVDRRWHLPEGHTEHTIGELINVHAEDYLNEARKLLPEILELNPCLTKITINDEEQIWDLVMGVISRLNFDDIKFYIEDWCRCTTHKGREWFAEIRRYEKQNRVPINWIPCGKTFNRIRRKVYENY